MFLYTAIKCERNFLAYMKKLSPYDLNHNIVDAHKNVIVQGCRAIMIYFTDRKIELFL